MKAVLLANSDGLPVPTLPSSSSLAMRNLKTFLNGITTKLGISNTEAWDNWQPRQSQETA
jgi:hypothetical protein